MKYKQGNLQEVFEGQIVCQKSDIVIARISDLFYGAVVDVDHDDRKKVQITSPFGKGLTQAESYENLYRSLVDLSRQEPYFLIRQVKPGQDASVIQDGKVYDCIESCHPEHSHESNTLYDFKVVMLEQGPPGRIFAEWLDFDDTHIHLMRS